MVCLGNICRSTLAEGILKNKLKNKDVFIDSCGTGDYHIGDAPDKRSIKVGLENSINISNQKARQLNSNDFKNFDLIYTMDKSVFRDVIELCPDKKYEYKVKMITEDGVPDPYYKGESAFLEVFNMLDIACEKISKQVFKK